MEKSDYTSLLERYSKKGRKACNPIMMHAVVTYANMRGVREADCMVELCERDLALIWLTKGRKPKRDAFCDFIGKRLTEDILEDLHYQFIKVLKKEVLVTLKALYIDGTKTEAGANRYTFVWRGTINYHPAGLPDAVDALYTKYNAFIAGNGYDVKYELGNAQMSIVEGMERIREVIRKNRERRMTKHKKLSNNTVIETDSCSPIEMLKLRTNLKKDC